MGCGGRAGSGCPGLPSAAPARRARGHGCGGHPVDCWACCLSTPRATTPSGLAGLARPGAPSWTGSSPPGPPPFSPLRHARQHLTPHGPATRGLVVAMPVTPGLPGGGELPNVPLEFGQGAGPSCPTPCCSPNPAPSACTTATSAAIPTRANVLGQLPGCTIVHFACHADSDPADPSRSLLLLHDHDRYPLTCREPRPR